MLHVKCKMGRESGGANADDEEEAGALRTLFAIAEEEVGAAGGAEVAHGDVLGAEAGGEELGLIGFF
jgi:hypothetical protein